MVTTCRRCWTSYTITRSRSTSNGLWSPCFCCLSYFTDNGCLPKARTLFLGRTSLVQTLLGIHNDLRLSSFLSDCGEEYFQELVSYPACLAKASTLVIGVDIGVQDLKHLRNEGLTHRPDFRRIHSWMDEELAGAGCICSCSSNSGYFPNFRDRLGSLKQVILIRLGHAG